jgi:hypothetical protein
VVLLFIGYPAWEWSGRSVMLSLNPYLQLPFSVETQEKAASVRSETRRFGDRLFVHHEWMTKWITLISMNINPSHHPPPHPRLWGSVTITETSELSRLMLQIAWKNVISFNFFDSFTSYGFIVNLHTLNNKVNFALAVFYLLLWNFVRSRVKPVLLKGSLHRVLEPNWGQLSSGSP